MKTVATNQKRGSTPSAPKNQGTVVSITRKIVDATTVNHQPKKNQIVIPTCKNISDMCAISLFVCLFC